MTITIGDGQVLGFILAGAGSIVTASAVINWKLIKREFDRFEESLKSTMGLAQKAYDKADSAKRRVVDVERVLQVQGCFDGDTCALEDDDSHPPIMPHRRRDDIKRHA